MTYGCARMAILRGVHDDAPEPGTDVVLGER
jgi:hypothetical protein